MQEKLVQKALKSMIHHGVVHDYTEESNASSPTKTAKTYYEADMDSVEMRLHFGHYLDTVRQFECGDAMNLEFAHFVIESLCLHGQCTRQQLFARFREHIKDSVDRIQSHSDSQHIKSERNRVLLLDDDGDSKMAAAATDDGGHYSFSLPFNVSKQTLNEWTRSLCTMPSDDRAAAVKEHFASIWEWLTTEKCFVVAVGTGSESEFGPNPRKRYVLSVRSIVVID